MTGPKPKPNATPFEKARARAQRRRPAPAPAPAPAAPRPSYSRAVDAVWARLRWGVARTRRSLRLWAAPRRRGVALLALALLSLSPFVGPTTRGAALVGGGLYLARLEHVCPPPHRGRWPRWGVPPLRQAALAELTARWYGRSALAPQHWGARRLVRGALLGAWGLSSWAHVWDPLAPLPWILDLGNEDTRPSQELGFIVCLGLGLFAGAGAAAGVGVPMSTLGRLAATGLRWGLAFRCGIPLREALAAVAALWAPWGAPLALVTVGGAALALGLRDIRALRYSPVWALAEAPAPSRRGAQALGLVGDLLFRPLGLMALTLAGGAVGGLLLPGPNEWAFLLLR